ncbi:hypothetical protein BUALT_Bualt11G0102500 [Buddleja alternifolia]|uniref:Cytochrome P450 n=1 Tax=Buddleja alternifolia TaxID=168488 RepID=A0AAV6WYR1_9LAMI|nr:hypothetical protein BUALT_Bualt11G0102500 [Buddleja alternifolia]
MAWLVLSFLAALIFYFKFKTSSSSKLPPPPGPRGWPLIGNIFDVGTSAHQSFHELQSKYGPVLHLKLGTVNTVVIQSSAAAAELFKKHDIQFSDRRVFDTHTACNYHKGSLAVARYGEYWRTVRRLCSSELTVHKRINDSASLRQKSIDEMIDWIKEDASKLGQIQIGKYIFFMTYNLMGNFMIGKDVMDLKSEKGNQFFEAVNQFIKWNGTPNLVDVFAFLRWIDPQGIRRNTEKHLGILLDLVAGFVKERIEEKKLGGKTRDFLDALLEFDGDGKGRIEKLSQKNVTIIIMGSANLTDFCEIRLTDSLPTGSTRFYFMAAVYNNFETQPPNSSWTYSAGSVHSPKEDSGNIKKMAWSSSLFPWFTTLIALFLFFKFLFKFRNHSSKLLPPGPPGWPLIGNIFDLGEVPHQTLNGLRAKYGPVIWLRLGAINTMVVQSSEAAAELFKKCDLPFADRKAPDSLTALDYNQGSVAIGTYSDYWRKLRRICTAEFLVHKRIDASMSLRQKCIDNLVDWIKDDVEKSRKNGGTGEIQLDRFLFVSAFNVIGNVMLSKDVMDSRLEKASEFFDLYIGFSEWVGKPNVADFVPFLKRVDPQRIRKNTEKYLGGLMEIASGIVKERIREKQSGIEKKTRDFLDALLDDEGDDNTKGPDKLTEKNITIILLVSYSLATICFSVFFS